MNIVRLLLSCLHAWSLDDELDELCEEVLGLVRPSRPVSFGLLSKGQCLSLVLPGELYGTCVGICIHVYMYVYVFNGDMSSGTGTHLQVPIPLKHVHTCTTL